MSGNVGGNGHSQTDLLINKAETLVETLRQAAIVVEDFQSESQPILNAKINKIIDQLQELYGLKDTFNNEIPIQLLEFVDSGQNPDLFAKDTLLNCKKRSDTTHGRIDSLEMFEESLESELVKQFGSEFVAELKSLRKPLIDPAEPI